MKSEKIGPMICLSVKKVYKKEQSLRCMLYYQITFREATMGATQLHAFKVERNGKELYLPTHMLKPGDNVWVDKSAFLADGSLIFNQCLSENTKIFTPIENIISTESDIHFQVGTVTIQASCSHPINIMRGANNISVSASELKAGDMFKTDISLLSPGNCVLGSDGEMHKITKQFK